jgi:putative membrane protein
MWPSVHNARAMEISILLAWASASFGLWVASQTLSSVRIRSFGDAIWAGALLGVLQWALSGPLFVALGIGTLGIGFLFWFLTRWIVGALIIQITSALSSRLDVDGFFPALVTALIVAATGSVLRFVLAA